MSGRRDRLNRSVGSWILPLALGPVLMVHTRTVPVLHAQQVIEAYEPAEGDAAAAALVAA